MERVTVDTHRRSAVRSCGRRYLVTLTRVKLQSGTGGEQEASNYRAVTTLARGRPILRANSDVCCLIGDKVKRLHGRARSQVRPELSATWRSHRASSHFAMLMSAFDKLQRSGARWPWCASASHFNWNTTAPSEAVGRAVPRLLAFLAIQSRATRMLSSVPALSW